MAFADHLTASRRTGGTPLLIAEHLAKMPPDEATAARQLLAADLSARQVAEAFNAEGYPVSESAVTNWRRARDQGRVE